MATNIGRPAAIYGLDDGVEQGTQLKWSLHTGETQLRTFIGPSDKVHAQYEAAKLWAANVPEVDEITFDAKDGIGELVISTIQKTTIVGGAGTSASIQAEPRWELFVNEERVPIQNAPFLDIAGNVIDDINKVMKAARANPAVKEAGWTAAAGGNGLGTLFDLVSRGVTDFHAHMYVARETRIVTTRQTITAAFAEVGNASGANAYLPAQPALSNPIFAGLSNLVIDWLVRSPQVRQVERRQWELSQEWWGIPIGTVAAGGLITTGRGAGWSRTLYPHGNGLP